MKEADCKLKKNYLYFKIMKTVKEVNYYHLMMKAAHEQDRKEKIRLEILSEAYNINPSELIDIEQKEIQMIRQEDEEMRLQMRKIRDEKIRSEKELVQKEDKEKKALEVQKCKEKLIQIKQETRRFVYLYNLVREDYSLAKIKEDQDETLIHRLDGGYYLFETLADPFLNNLLLLDNIVPSYNLFSSTGRDHNRTKAFRSCDKHFSSERYSPIRCERFEKHFQLGNYSPWFYVRDEKEIIFSFIFNREDSEQVLAELYGEDNLISLPTKYNCNACNFHTDRKDLMISHTSSNKHLRALGKLQEKKEETFFCKPCKYSTGSKQAWTGHIGCTKHLQNTGQMRRKIKKISYSCDVCKGFPSFPNESRYKAHRKGKKCMLLQKKKEEEKNNS